MNAWRDYGDLRSYLHKPDGQVLAEMLSAGHDRWSISVYSRARGVWIGRDLAKAACERIVHEEQPGRIVVMANEEFPPMSPGYLDVFKRWFA